MAATATTEAVASQLKSALKFIPRRSAARGHADHGWLKSYHTCESPNSVRPNLESSTLICPLLFLPLVSFASYQDPAFSQYGSLRVINEDRVDPGEGFGQHSHREFEIWSYIISGELEHRDSLGNLEIMKRGDIQMTSTGTGISHSEYNRNSKTPVHFAQIWGMPHTKGLKPSYYNRHFTDAEKTNVLVRVVAPVGRDGVIDSRNAQGPAPIHSYITMHASILEPGQSISYELAKTTKRAFLHLLMRSGYRKPSVSASDKYDHGGAILKLNKGLVLEEGDASFIEVNKEGDRKLEVKNVADTDGEWLLFEMEE
ncbi:BZ3500_MvSof-1268-A1-R1_Chr5-2g07755 [Microbotryum saponariae]|uniref:BZ3500_MvSof-1268-A1-R1_Chr5-2g07755 protein n=1 Tax=Microbotryum saponariae TaxID=289078 RepID=A0A2X0LF46_9BASI|nr:BZ3500_MvSof-1268-A1-R1_Chr5-2g07755 [Microbotryum saponariae]SDA05624.1 BZ3501_MvSof-1269-A2-R1_Chr5-2g07577 [Microbotryum saponariae]